METACSACGGPLPVMGVYSVSLSLRPDAPKRWRTVAITCSLPCLAEVTTQMQDSVLRRQHRHDHVAAVMSTRPKGR